MAETGLVPHRVPVEDAPAYVRAVELAFGHVADEDDVADWTEWLDPDYALAISDGGRIVATAGANAYELTLPGPDLGALPFVPAIGVTAVGVHPSHRRRGLLTRLMQRQLDDLRAEGVALAMLTASEAGIYGRFGYGLATSHHALTIDTRRSRFTQPPAATGSMRIIDAAEAAGVLPELHEQVRRLRPGDVSRHAPWWSLHLRDRPNGRDGGDGRIYAVHHADGGRRDGYVSYRYHHDWTNGLAAHRVAITDLCATTPDVEAALWRYVLDLDLAGYVTMPVAPVDTALRWRLRDPRQLVVTGRVDLLWVRIIDVARVLAARRYGTEDRLVLDVVGDDGGRVVLETGGSTAACRPAQAHESVDLTTGLADLGALLLGGVSWTTLAAAGRVDEHRRGVLARADAAFASVPAPFCSTSF